MFSSFCQWGFRWMFLWIIIVSAACSSTSKEESKSIPTNLGMALDSTVRPQDNFYQFVNGRWLQNSIPDDAYHWSLMDEARKKNQQEILQIIQQIASNPAINPGSDPHKVSDFYAMGMDSLRAASQDAKPIKAMWDRLSAVKSVDQLQFYWINQTGTDAEAFFKLEIRPNPTDRKSGVYLEPAELGLPTREFYVSNDPYFVEVRKAYGNHIGNLLGAMGDDPARVKRAAERIIVLETELARATVLESDDVYNSTLVADFTKTNNQINWRNLFTEVGIQRDTFLIRQPGYFKTVNRILDYYPIEDIQYYLKWCLLRNAAEFLSHRFVNESFAFRQKYLLGVPKLSPRWRRVLNQTEIALGEVVGRTLARRRLTPELRDSILEMTTGIRLAFAERVKQLEWMTDSTKSSALKKLRAVKVIIGYPEMAGNLMGLSVKDISSTSTYYDNWITVKKFRWNQTVAKLNENGPTQPLLPQDVKIVYDPYQNELFIPAGVIQSPFFGNDPAASYGSLGLLIAKELSKAIDETGSLIDHTGVQMNWWTSSDLINYQAKKKLTAKMLSDRKGSVTPTLNQNFIEEYCATEAGVTIAWMGLQRYYRENFYEASLVQNGLSAEERFFIAAASSLKSRYRPEALQVLSAREEVSDMEFMLNTCLTNIPEFQEAFDVKVGDKLHREEKERIRIW